IGEVRKGLADWDACVRWHHVRVTARRVRPDPFGPMEPEPRRATGGDYAVGRPGRFGKKSVRFVSEMRGGVPGGRCGTQAVSACSLRDYVETIRPTHSSQAAFVWHKRSRG